MGTCGLLIYKKILLIDYHSGNPSTGKSIEPKVQANLKQEYDQTKTVGQLNQTNPND
ncbi:hypothetical protein C5L31_001097 [Secundilactobacillus malefermentans]|uniref:Uncharacterized protein n=1 Tax=Secundilactobacillus malefermentans TaxID=176292 RepID=A0A4R5NQX9_9LACO|nr:hypothetical protein C5L31_001097 [Secundilactobacillus malefermentans]